MTTTPSPYHPTTSLADQTQTHAWLRWVDWLAWTIAVSPLLFVYLTGLANGGADTAKLQTDGTSVVMTATKIVLSYVVYAVILLLTIQLVIPGRRFYARLMPSLITFSLLAFALIVLAVDPHGYFQLILERGENGG